MRLTAYLAFIYAIYQLKLATCYKKLVNCFKRFVASVLIYTLNRSRLRKNIRYPFALISKWKERQTLRTEKQLNKFRTKKRKPQIVSKIQACDSSDSIWIWINLHMRVTYLLPTLLLEHFLIGKIQTAKSKIQEKSKREVLDLFPTDIVRAQLLYTVVQQHDRRKSIHFSALITSMVWKKIV